MNNNLAGDQDPMNPTTYKDAEDILVIDIPGPIGGGTLAFKSTYVHFQDIKVYYEDVESISIHGGSEAVPVPGYRSYKFKIASAKNKMSFSIGTTLLLKRKSKEEACLKVAGIWMQLLSPIIIAKISNRIFDRNEEVKIGPIRFTKAGYTTNKVGWKASISWDEQIPVPRLVAGTVYVLSPKRPLPPLTTSIPNAVLIPELVQECFARAHGIGGTIEIEKIRHKLTVDFITHTRLPTEYSLENFHVGVYRGVRFIRPKESCISSLESGKYTPIAPILKTKRCPFCAEDIKPEAIVCRYCGRDLPS